VDEIKFDAKYKEWLVSKKLEVGDKTKPRDVAEALAQIREEVSNKSFQLSGVDTKKIDALAAKLVGDKRGHEAVAEVFRALKPKEVKQELLNACSNEKVLPIAQSYFNQAIFERVKVNTCVKPDLVKYVYGKKE